MSVTELIATPAETILARTSDLRAGLLEHSIYRSVCSHEDLRTFMKSHAFAVNDFMWLLKRLQREICGTGTPWTPPASPQLARFINEIVLGEESDEDGRGGYCSHFELYLRAMADVGASTDVIDQFTIDLRNEANVPIALQNAGVPEPVRRFTLANYDLATTGSAAQVAAAFCFGREDIIPDMFERLLNGFEAANMVVPGLRHYIERHIELDGDHHGPLSHEMVNLLCGSSPDLLDDAVAAARSAISNRIALWDGIQAQLEG